MSTNANVSTVLQLTFVVLAAAGVYSFVTSIKEAESRRICTPVCSIAPDYADNNRLAPDITLPDLDGNMVRLSDYRGKTVILNFWTKSCEPCLQEMPSLSNLGKVLRDRDDIVLLTVTTDESAEDARATLASVLGEIPSFVTLVDPESDVVRGKFGTKLYPETWFIDPNGVIRARIDGPRNWLELAPLSILFAESISGPLSCPVTFKSKTASGNFCHDVPVSG